MIFLYQVGFVRQMELIKEAQPFIVKTLSIRPPIFGKCIKGYVDSYHKGDIFRVARVMV